MSDCTEWWTWSVILDWLDTVWRCLQTIFLSQTKNWCISRFLKRLWMIKVIFVMKLSDSGVFIIIYESWYLVGEAAVSYWNLKMSPRTHTSCNWSRLLIRLNAVCHDNIKLYPKFFRLLKSYIAELEYSQVTLMWPWNWNIWPWIKKNKF